MNTTPLGFLPLATTIIALTALARSAEAQTITVAESTSGFVSATGPTQSEFEPVPTGLVSIEGFSTAVGISDPGNCQTGTSASMSAFDDFAILSVSSYLLDSDGTCTLNTGGNATMRLEMTAPTPTPVTITLTLNAPFFGTPSFDVHSDSTKEFETAFGAGAGVYTVSAILTPEPFSVSMSGNITLDTAAFSGSQLMSATLTVEVSDDPGTLQTEQSACGPVLGATAYEAQNTNDTIVRFVASESDATPFAAFLVGVQPLGVALPPFGCVLGTEILASVPATVDPSGRATLEASLPSDIPNTFRVQYLTATLDAPGFPEWRTSNVANLTLP